MTYKKKVILLLILIASLCLLYAGSFIFSYDSGSARSSSMQWLDSASAAKVNRITVNSGYDQFELLLKNSQWYVKYNNNEYPARKMRVDDFLRIFSTRSLWPMRSSSSSSHESFGVGRAAEKITFYENYSVLLDLLLGSDDIMGREMYFRKSGQNEVRSGDINIRSYISGTVTGWYNLRLIPESEEGNININNIQRLTVYNGDEMQVFTRSGRRWEISGVNLVNPDMSVIDEYVNFVLNAEGDDFLDPALADGISYDQRRIIYEFGNGKIVTVRLSAGDDDGRCYAMTSGGNLIYQIPLWVTLRLFMDSESFQAD